MPSGALLLFLFGTNNRMRSCPKRAFRALQRAVTGKSQLERSLEKHDVIAFRSYLIESDELHDEIGMFIVSDFPLEIDKALTVIEKRKPALLQSFHLTQTLHRKLRMLNRPNMARRFTDDLALTSVTLEKHQALIKGLWKFLGDGSATAQWSKLGFQNDKFPYTDFRGEGVLALYCLLYLGQTNPEKAKIWISRTDELPFAVLSVNITRWTRTLLHDKATTPLDHFFFECGDSRAEILARFATVQWALFEMFVDFWETAGETNSVAFPMRSEEFRKKLLPPVLSQIQLDTSRENRILAEYLSV